MDEAAVPEVRARGAQRALLGHPFVRFVLGRGAFYLVAIVAGFTMTFFIPRLMPGNPVDMMLRPSQPGLPGLAGGASPAVGRAADFARIRAALEEFFGFDRPLHHQYLVFWQRLFRGDLGPSFAFNMRPVSEVVGRALLFTLVLVLPVLVLSFYLGNAIGAAAAVSPRWGSSLVYYGSLVFAHMPFYWFAMILSFVFALKAGWFPFYGWHSPELLPNWSLNFVLDVARHYALPFLALLVGSIGTWTVGMWSMMLYEMRSDYILYCQQLGFRKKTLKNYAKRNAMLPQYTGFNLVLSGLIGQTVITEVVFGWPGLGSLGYRAILSRDYPLLMGTFLVTVVVVLLGNFVMDILYGLIDPRIRTGYVERG
ncbi:MAG: ABC transporter permease [Candidatus Bipolaricaulaceae bacterium]